MRKTLLLPFIFFGVTTIMAAPSMAQEPVSETTAFPAQNPGSSSLMHSPTLIKWEMRGSDKKIIVVDADAPGGQALSARIKKRKKRPWEIALWFDLDDGASAGDQVEISFWARTVKAAKGQETAEIIAFVGRNEEPYDNIISEEIAPDSEWQLYTINGTAGSDFSDGKLKAEFQLAKHKQIVEIGQVFVSKKSLPGE